MTTTNRLRRVTLAAAVPVLATALLLGGCGLNTPAEEISPTHPTTTQPAQPDADSGGATEAGATDAGAREDGPTLSETTPNTPTLAVTPQDAAQVALDAHAGSRVVSLDLDRSHGVTVWEVEVVTADAKYEVEVNASTGEVVKNEQERTSHLAQYNAYLDAAKLTYADAIEAALAEHPDATLVEMELDEEHGVIVWEVEVVTADRATYDMEIDAISGKILKNELDD